eukprot:TRINITY_DN29496_c0_g1_i1.p1 TRINITY_DN29496_c0_g1~~TRINITY_DN29496_c0_g1_i1.p1  ORF type:complete len:305 (+),score=49.92 TRINITY_DN29496_c0_g1_i1:69-983(+)
MRFAAMETDLARFFKILGFCLVALFVKASVQRAQRRMDSYAPPPSVFVFGELRNGINGGRVSEEQDRELSHMDFGSLPLWFYQKRGLDISRGAAFSAAGSTVLEHNLGTISLESQVGEFVETFRAIAEASGYRTEALLSASSATISAGRNDITIYSRNQSVRASAAPQIFVESILQTYQTLLLRLQEIGVRKFLIVGVCESCGEGCREEERVMMRMFNRGLRRVLMDLSALNSVRHDRSALEPAMSDSEENMYSYANECDPNDLHIILDFFRNEHQQVQKSARSIPLTASSPSFSFLWRPLMSS